MINLLSTIFGKSDIVKEGLAMLRDTGDSLIYTDEEKAKDQADRVAAERNIIINWMDTTKGQNLARRLLALIITSVWLFMYIISATLNIVAIWITNPDNIKESAIVIGNYAEQMTGAMMLILAFYFAAPHMGKIVDSALNRFGGTK